MKKATEMAWHRRVRRLLTVAIVLAATAPACATATFNGVDVSGHTSYAQDFRLTDHDGRSRTLADFRGKVVVLFFGYLQCPNFCPYTLGQLAEVMRLLGSAANKVQVLFVTLDPARDTPGALKEYVTTFDPSFIGLYGTIAETPELALRFRVYYEKVKSASAGHYDIDHAVFSYAYDPAGRLRLVLGPELSSAQIAADLRQLLSEH